MARANIKPTPTGRIIVDAAKGRIPAYIDTGLNIVHVHDVAIGHWLAYEKGVIGERYILGGEDKSLNEILNIIARLCKKEPPKYKLKRELLFPVAAGMELLAKVTGREPLLTIDALLMAAKKMYFSSSKAHKELGYTARPAETAITDALAWFKTNKYL